MCSMWVGRSFQLSRSLLSACRCRFLERWTRHGSQKQGHCIWRAEITPHFRRRTNFDRRPLWTRCQICAYAERKRKRPRKVKVDGTKEENCVYHRKWVECLNFVYNLDRISRSRGKCAAIMSHSTNEVDLLLLRPCNRLRCILSFKPGT